MENLLWESFELSSTRHLKGKSQEPFSLRNFLLLEFTRQRRFSSVYPNHFTNFSSYFLLNTWFERISMLVILLNCITLGMFQPCVDDKCEKNRCKILQVSYGDTFVRQLVESKIKFIHIRHGSWAKTRSTQKISLCRQTLINFHWTDASHV